MFGDELHALGPNMFYSRVLHPLVPAVADGNMFPRSSVLDCALFRLTALVAFHRLSFLPKPFPLLLTASVATQSFQTTRANRPLFPTEGR